MDGADIVRSVFEVEFGDGDVNAEAGRWLDRFPERKIRSLEEAASYIVDELDHQYLKDYDPQEGLPPCSIMRAARGQPLNCVGRVASLVLLSELKDYSYRMGEKLMIEIEVEYKQKTEGGKRIDSGHVTAYTTRWGDRTYLGTKQGRATEKYRVRMLPSIYALQTALAKIIEEKYGEAKKMAGLAEKWNVDDSNYVGRVATRIKEG